MIIVIAIIGIITIVVIVSQGSFNKSLILSNAAYDLALAIRSAESYGVGARLSTGADTHLGYGLRFSVGGTFTFFADSSPASPSVCHPAPRGSGSESDPDAKWGDCVYTACTDLPACTNGDKVVTTYTLNRGITVSSICTYAGSAPCVAASSLDISFVRPDPTPNFAKNGLYDPMITSACIELVSPQGGAKYVSVEKTGQITANAAPCP